MRRNLLTVFVILLVITITFPNITGLNNNGKTFNKKLYPSIITPNDDNRDEYYQFLIISPDYFSSELQILKEHKKQHGIRTKIVTLYEIFDGIYFPVFGRDDAEKIKYFIKNAKENWSIEYVMLVGDKDLLPARYVDLCSWGEHFDFFSDLYYADIYDDNGGFCSWDSNQDNVFSGKNMSGVEDDVDLYPDLSVGRLLCKNLVEVQIVVEKIIDYENNAYGQNWFYNVILCGGDDARLKWREKEFPEYFNRESGILWEGEYMGDKVADYLHDFSPRKIYATGLFKASIDFLSISNINEAINDGAGFLLFVGHGNPSMAIKTNFPFCEHIWLPFPYGYYTSNCLDLNNGEKLPIAVFAGCSCGDFNAISSPIAWEFVKKENGGSIASFAATTGSIILFSTLCTETYTGYLSLDVFRLYSEDFDILGDIWSSTIINYLNDEEAWQLGDDFSVLNWNNKLANNQVLEEWILFGDPTLKIGGYP